MEVRELGEGGCMECTCAEPCVRCRVPNRVTVTLYLRNVVTGHGRGRHPILRGAEDKHCRLFKQSTVSNIAVPMTLLRQLRPSPLYEHQSSFHPVPRLSRYFG